MVVVEPDLDCDVLVRLGNVGVFRVSIFCVVALLSLIGLDVSVRRSFLGCFFFLFLLDLVAKASVLAVTGDGDCSSAFAMSRSWESEWVSIRAWRLRE